MGEIVAIFGDLVFGGVSTVTGIVSCVGLSRLRLHGFRLGPDYGRIDGINRDHQWNNGKVGCDRLVSRGALPPKSETQ